MTIPSLSQSTTHPLTGGGKPGGEITQKPITFFLRHPVSKVESVALGVVLERRRFPSLGVTILSDLPNHVLPLGPRNHLGKLLQFLELLPQPRPPAVILPSDQCILNFMKERLKKHQGNAMECDISNFDY
nr:hypothetical protein Iba_chr12fCG9320 [Ipomoea batatas]GME20944.1 hypothetical protein Iba_scaffold26467CG0360 [Ipomoea batatas]